MKPFMSGIFMLVLAIFALCVLASAQQKKTPAKPAATSTPAAPATTSEKKAEETKPAEGGESAKSTKEDAELKAGMKEDKKVEEDEEKQYKESASVKKIGSWLGLSPTASYWANTILNFLVIVILFFALMKSSLPKAFRDRTDAIRKGMEEARKASAEAKTRLGSIEERLAKLDDEIEAMQTATERNIRVEEDRLRLAAQEEARKIEESVKTEVATASTLARRELKQFAAELAVGLAEKKISVSEANDRALVSDFGGRLQGGKGGN